MHDHALENRNLNMQFYNNTQSHANMFAFQKQTIPYIIFLCINKSMDMWDLQFWHMEVVALDYVGHCILNFDIASPTLNKNHKQNIQLPQT
jgi:hypothetical protein